jgi:hypothetical protein
LKLQYSNNPLGISLMEQSKMYFGNNSRVGMEVLLKFQQDNNTQRDKHSYQRLRRLLKCRLLLLGIE